MASLPSEAKVKLLERLERKCRAIDPRITVQSLENSQRVSLEAGLLSEKDALKSFEGLYTDEFVK